MQISERLRSIKPSLTLSVNSRALELKAQGVDVTSLAVGEPDFPTPRHICDAAKAAIDANFCRYTAVPGIPDLRKAAGRYFERNYGTPVPMESIIIGAGGKHCLYNFMQATINPGDEVLIPAPYWLSYPDMVELAGGVPVTVHAGPERNFKVTPLMLEEKTTDKTRLLVLNSPSNPTGAVYSDREFMQIMRWALARNIFVLSDEIYDQLVFPPAKMTSAITWFEHCPELVAVLNGLSKSYAMTGWRLGYACGPAPIIKIMTKIHQSAIMSAPTTSQYAAITALRECDGEIDKMRDEYNMRRRLVVHGFNSMGLTCFEPRGAFYAFPCIKSTGMTSQEFCTKLLEQKHVALVPGDAFGASGEGYCRVSYAYSVEHLTEAMKRIREFLKENGINSGEQ